MRRFAFPDRRLLHARSAPPDGTASCALPGRVGTFYFAPRFRLGNAPPVGAPIEGRHMNGLIYLVGLIVVIMAVLSILGLR
jgi:hypothetical protein